MLCDTRLAACPKGAHYPKPNGTVVLKAMPKGLPTMPNPCHGVPTSPWCPGGHPAGNYGPQEAGSALYGFMITLPDTDLAVHSHGTLPLADRRGGG